MKYCKKDKIAAADSDLVCPRCGGPLSVFGASATARTTAGTATPPRPAPSDAASGTTFQLQGQVRRLEQAHEGNLRRGRRLALLGGVAAAAIVLILWQVYARTVLAYAELEEIRIEQNPAIDHMIRVRYRVTTPGKVAFDRRSGSRHTEKLDVIAQTGPEGFTWAWPSDPRTGVDFDVVYRGGWLLRSEHRHFDVQSDTTNED
jgi:hypothetical protein